jgi:hypothetical protein
MQLTEQSRLLATADYLAAPAVLASSTNFVGFRFSPSPCFPTCHAYHHGETLLDAVN